MAEKDYKALYERQLKEKERLRRKIGRLKATVRELEAERFSCDTVPLTGELFGRHGVIVRIDGWPYVRLKVWTRLSSRVFDIFLRGDNAHFPVPLWFHKMPDVMCLISRTNFGRFVMNPEEGQPRHLLITGNVESSENWNDDYASSLQVEHDELFLQKLAESAAEFADIACDEYSSLIEDDSAGLGFDPEWHLLADIPPEVAEWTELGTY